ncbi:MAG: hypothetical protein ABI863_17410 [Ginsengibacter sp.]
MEFVNEEVTTIDPKTHEITFSRFRQVPLGRFIKDTSIINPASVSMHFSDITFKKEQKIKFETSSVEVVNIDKGIIDSHVYKIDEGCIDDNIILDICGYFPLKKGIRFRLNCFNSGTPNKIVNAFETEYSFDDYLPTENEAMTKCKVLNFINGDKTGYIWIDIISNKNMKWILILGLKISYCKAHKILAQANPAKELKMPTHRHQANEFY